MSISSMLGSDADRPSRDPPSSSIFSRPSMSSSPFASAHPPAGAAGAMSPPTAPARPASSLDQSLFRRSQTPDKLYSKNNQPRQSRSGSGSGASQPPPPPEASKFGPSRGPQPFSQYSDKPSTSLTSPPVTSAESGYNQSPRLGLSGPTPRPSSQPQQEEARGPGFSPRSRASGEGPSSNTQRQTSYPEAQRYNGLYSDRAREEQAARERERGAGHEPDTKAPGGPLHGRYGSHFGDREAERPQNAPPWDPGRSSPESRRFPASSEPGSGFGFGAIQSYTKSLGSQLGASRPPPPPPPAAPSQHHSSGVSIQPRQGQPTPPPSEQPYLSKLQTQPRIFSATSAPSGSQPSALGGSTATTEEQRRKGSDDLMQHRSLLGLGVDGKRAGRASPLPQAVQGAQAQLIGPAGEAGIKGELGRVFAGIGSGVGTSTSGTVGSGPSTPMTASPFKRDSVAARSDTTDDGRAGRGVIVGPGRKRSVKEEEAQGENGDQTADLRGAAVSARGGARRGRHVHHHHHHHHHHRHKTDEEASRTPSSSLNLYGRTGTPTEAAAGAGSSAGTAHHHHHHHHHHHLPRPASSAVSATPAPAPPREPQTIVNLEPLLKSVAHLPRHHLGSTLYAPRIGVPTPNAPLESQKFGYTTTPVPIPRFEGKENCTFTVRVPRFRIDASHREEICARRALWGTGVYTDDSDPVAAAIHSGFIRGEWGEDVDISMLDLEIKDTYQHAPKIPPDAPQEARIPPVPPPDKDLHITLLILPRLERYESSVMFGLKSRAWDGTHDGMSFKVERIEWVNEGSTRGEERSGEARRKRLRNMMRTGRICTGPNLLRLRGGPTRLSNSEGVATTTTATTSAPVESVS
ncbi:hypothetical protein T310_7445 [Rasamsonia emersonii CBS 393.64]|uniref:Histone deacetylation protein Rxt3 n=1 Tax=Rasamsonia emersonii (strain ATCC 16479 / CBS 393.64 / IMI 116815) TaxID=1408163 RepID=A0A0F4YLW5_RASE3|nr:hypothetical protein T310_7445 [Rasamsonia emersonii CBS 393.64]KKA18608.1 hypothetical protein T310_7445 [Rasamsonia emersonii CBS 393.64]